MRYRSTLLMVILAGLLLCFALFPSTGAAQEGDQLNKRDLKLLIATAASTADHKRLAAYYRDEGERLQTKQKDHEEEAAEYFKDPSHHPSPKWPTMGQHCDDLAAFYGKAAQQALVMAEMHEQMAREAAAATISPK